MMPVAALPKARKSSMKRMWSSAVRKFLLMQTVRPPVVMSEVKVPLMEAGTQLRISGRVLRRADGQTCGDDERGFAVYFLRSNDTDAGGSHCAEHEKGGFSEYGVGHHGEEYADDGEEHRQSEHAGSEIVHVSAGYAGELDDAVVLRKDGVGKGAENACQERVESIGQHATRNAFQVIVIFDRPARKHGLGCDVACSFDGSYEIDQSNGRKVSMNSDVHVFAKWG